MKAIVIQGLGFGDEGKGSIVDFLCRNHKVRQVVRFNGGHQAAHNVVTSNGKHHCFSQFGSGTFCDVPTFLDRHMIVDPLALLEEAAHLEKVGVKHPLHKIDIHPDCLVTTIYHRIANRIIDNRTGHGSCGVGVGLTRQMWSETGDSIRWEDVWSSDLRLFERKMDWVRQWCLDKVNSEYAKGRVEDAFAGINHRHETERLFQSEVISYHKNMKFGEDDRDTVIYEGAQGFGLDEVHGTVPHTTYSDTTSRIALEALEAYESVQVIGVTRTYETRHGNGPMHHEKHDMSHDKREHNNGGFAGKFRAGVLDVRAISKAADKCEVDYIALNHLDVLKLTPRAKQLIADVRPILIEGHGPTASDKKYCNLSP